MSLNAFLTSSLFQAAQVQWRLTRVSEHAAGQDFVVFRAESASHGPLALRVPKHGIISDGIDDGVSSLQLLKQEATLLTILRDHGMPCPISFGVVESQGDSCLAMQFVEGETGTALGENAGLWFSAIHRIRIANDLTLESQPPGDFTQTVARLVARRAKTLETIVGVALELPDESELRGALSGRRHLRSLLHMDMRPENVVRCEGKVVALLDWSNALIGDPWLDICRAEEYGVIDDPFWRGYGTRPQRPTRSVEIIYRLYTTIMLGLLFNLHVRDRLAAQHAVERTLGLVAELNSL